MTDYVGNRRVQTYLINIENPLYYIELEADVDAGSSVGFPTQLEQVAFVAQFNTYISTSGTIATSGVLESGAFAVNSLELTVFRPSTNQTFNAGNALTFVVRDFEVEVRYSGSQYQLLSGDVITLRFKDDDGVTPIITSVLDYALLAPFSQSITWAS
jgi:hypothetical protein